jgi:hypothetical protein
MSITSATELTPARYLRARVEALLWPTLLVAAAIVGSGAFACATPFAAFAAIAAGTMPAGAALATVATIWVANQAIGFFALSYPWTLDTTLWGVALGAAALLATLTAIGLHGRVKSIPAWLRLPAAFAAAFVAFEIVLAGTALALGGLEDFAPAIVGEVLQIAVAWLVGLWATHALLQRTGALPRAATA